MLVSLTQSLLHYSSVCSKLGVNLHASRENCFKFVDGLTSLLSNVLPETDRDDASAKTEEKSGRVMIALGRYYEKLLWILITLCLVTIL